MGGALNNVVEQIGEGYFQCPGNLPESAEFDVGCASFDFSEMGAINTASLGKGRLRRPVFSLAKVADSGPSAFCIRCFCRFFWFIVLSRLRSGDTVE